MHVAQDKINRHYCILKFLIPHGTFLVDIWILVELINNQNTWLALTVYSIPSILTLKEWEGFH